MYRFAAKRCEASSCACPACKGERVLNTTGRPLEPAVRSEMERRFGHDFGQVRIHDDGGAAAAAAGQSANAFSRGEHIAFAAGRYRPETAAGRRLLAHELTHVVQQRGGGAVRGAAQDEGEAGAVAAAVVRGAPLPPIGRSAPAVRRDGPWGSPEEQEANHAEVMCDIATLCGLHTTHPEVVSDSRIESAAHRCRPDVFSPISPCFNPAFFPLPSQSPATTPAAGAPAASSGLPDLGELTTFNFNLGPARFTVELPSAVKIQLPVALQSSHRITFDLQATRQGAFSFSITLDGLPHVRLSAQAGVDLEHERVTGGLTITTTRTVCRAQDAASARSALESAGNHLRDAIRDLQNPPTGEDAPSLGTTELVGGVVGAIGEVYEAVERARAPCREVPVLTIQGGMRAPLTPESEEPRFGGITATLHF